MIVRFNWFIFKNRSSRSAYSCQSCTLSGSQQPSNHSAPGTTAKKARRTATPGQTKEVPRRTAEQKPQTVVRSIFIVVLFEICTCGQDQPTTDERPKQPTFLGIQRLFYQQRRRLFCTPEGYRKKAEQKEVLG